jgi:hypothetical protein
MFALPEAESTVETLDHEVKFRLPASAAAPARTLLIGLCRVEAPHARSRVGTIYLDDRALSSAGEKLASDYRKTKFRLRWYDGGGGVHLEVKRRHGSRREKLRLPIATDGAALEAGGLAAAARSPWREALRAAGVEAPGDLAPALRLVYDRERFVDPASGARLSLDTAIAALEIAPWAGVEPAAGVPLDAVVVESKGSERSLPPALAALHALGARRGSFSKYAACLFRGSN